MEVLSPGMDRPSAITASNLLPILLSHSPLPSSISVLFLCQRMWRHRWRSISWSHTNTLNIQTYNTKTSNMSSFPQMVKGSSSLDGLLLKCLKCIILTKGYIKTTTNWVAKWLWVALYKTGGNSQGFNCLKKVCIIYQEIFAQRLIEYLTCCLSQAE